MPATSTDRLQGVLTSTAVKAPCKAVTTTAITLNGEKTVGGVACATGDRVLVAISGGSVNNGIWVVDTGDWSRAKDFDGNRDAVDGTIVLVAQDGASRFWQVSGDDPIQPGQSAIEIEQIDPSALYASANNIAFDPPFNYVAYTLGWAIKQGLVSVGWFTGADPTGTTDSTAAFAAAALLGGGRIYVPPGTWAINWTITAKVIIEGAGSNSTFIKPFSTAVAAMTYRHAGPYWTYHSEVRGLCFKGTGKVGVGFTFGRTNPADYVAGDEYFNNVKFYGVRFEGLRKGVQFPFGNIGTEFYSCNWAGNFYGVYALNGKFGGDPMHAGNKYFYGGEFNSNDCAVYMHNAVDGLYGFAFNGVIFEQNKINGYLYTANSCQQPMSFTACGMESNGSYLGGSTTLDQWAGSALSTAVFTNRNWIIDGATADAYFDQCGMVTDINLIATNTVVSITRSRVESTVGVGGAECTVASADSRISMDEVVTDYGPPRSARCTVDGNISYRQTSAANATTRWSCLPHRASKETSYGGSGLRQNFTGASGTVNTTGLVIASVNVADGSLYATCSEYSVPGGTGGSFAAVPTTGTITPAIGRWIVATVQAKWVSGVQPVIYIGDLSSNQIWAGAMPPEIGGWFTIGGIGQMQAATAIGMQFAGNASAGVLRLSALQIRAFTTRREAENFLQSLVYVES